MMKSAVRCLIFVILSGVAPAPTALPAAERFELAQFTPLNFNAWRPYKNPDRLVQVGMNKGQVLAIAGKPDHEDTYYQGIRGWWGRTSDWYYVKTDAGGETTLLKFSGETLVSISITPVQ